MQDDLKNDLLEILKREKELYQQLFEIAEEKNEALLENNTETLSETLKRDQKVIEKIEAAEKERKKIIELIKAELNLELEDDKYSNLIEKLPLEWEKSLNKIRAELIELTDEFYSLNNQNQQLLNQALKFNDFSISSILKSIKDNEKNTYTKDAKVKEKQPRIINKKG